MSCNNGEIICSDCHSSSGLRGWINLDAKDLKCFMKWIKMSDREPPEDVEVLFCKRRAFSGPGSELDLIDCGFYNYHFNRHTATHWMPLPPAPKEEAAAIS